MTERSHPLQDADDAVLVEVATRMEKRTFPAGAVVFGGAESAELVLVLEGTASCAQGDNGGVSELSTGDYYGEDAMLFGTSHAVSLLRLLSKTASYYRMLLSFVDISQV